MKGLKAALVVWCLAFLSVVFGMLVSFGTKIFELSWSDWRSILAAGVAAVVVAIAGYIDSMYKRYGNGSNE